MKTVSPMLATLIDEPFDSKEWIFEIKWDGYRALAVKKGNAVRLLSRNNQSFTERYPNIVDDVKRLSGDFIIDGEIVILDAKGRSHFQLLQNYLRRKIGTPYYYVFDILSYRGQDVRGKPLLERKKILKKLLRGKSHLRYSDHIVEKGKAFFRAAARKGLEGIMAKKSDSTYQSRRSRDWLKIKAGQRQEVVIGGFTEPKGSRKHFGALLVGVYEKGKLVYAGRVGGGFDAQLLSDVHRELKKLVTSQCPFSSAPRLSATWVKPKLVCEVSFTEWTEEGKLRHPIFQGLRIDKPAKQVVKE